MSKSTRNRTGSRRTSSNIEAALNPARNLSPFQLTASEYRLKGNSQKQSHSRACADHGLPNHKGGSAATRLFSNPDVIKYIAQQRADLQGKLDFTREDLAFYLVRVLHTAPNEVNNDNRDSDTRLGANNEVCAINPSKLAAGALLARMMGWFEPERHVLEAGDTLNSLVDRMRGGNVDPQRAFETDGMPITLSC